MKITYLKLKNFIGIYNGMGKYEFELDFSKGDNIITLLLGINGSGKSTILSTLHPFSGTFDDKANIILTGVDGYKEIHIDRGDRTYKICHIYENKKKNRSIKSFISYTDDNGNEVELNENGGVRTFEEVIKNELDLVPSFMTLSRIGSNVSGFIEKKSTERKKMISDFLPDIADFLFNYKIVNDKWSLCRKEIKSLADQINKIDSIDKLESSRLSVSTDIKRYQDMVHSEMKIVTENEYQLKTIDPDGEIRNKYIECVNLYKESNEKLNELLQKSFGKYDTLEYVNESIGKLNTKRALTESNLDSLRQTVVSKTSELINLKDQLESKTTQLSSHLMEKNLEEYIELRDDYINKIKDCDCYFNDSELDYEFYKNFTLDDLAKYDDQYSKLEESIKAIKEKSNMKHIESVSNITIDSEMKLASSLTLKNESLNNELNELIKENANLLANVAQSEMLDKRPTTCSDDTCPFIREALRYANVDIKLKNLQVKMDEINNEIKKNTEAINTINEKYMLYIDMNTQYQFIKNSFLSSMDFFNDFTFEQFKELFMSAEKKDKYRDISEYKDLVSTIMDRKSYTELLKEVESNITILENKQELINTLTEDVNSLTVKIMEIEEYVSEAEDKITTYNTNLEKLDKLENVLKDAKETYIEIDKLNVLISDTKLQIKEMEDDTNRIKQCNRTIKECKAKIEEYESLIIPLEKELETLVLNINKLNEITTTKEKLDKDFVNLNIVRDALNPTKGIPLLFINTYLTQTKLIANKLLDVAFKGTFRIDSFEVTDKDFFIKMQKEDGELMSDILYASQGEKALVSIAISLALIQQSMKKYNILLLDEIDAELDFNNRKSFIDILEAQFQMLSIEQCILITHNNEFDSYATNLVLLKGNNVDVNNKEYMDNKKIIFEV